MSCCSTRTSHTKIIKQKLIIKNKVLNNDRIKSAVCVCLFFFILWLFNTCMRARHVRDHRGFHHTCVCVCVQLCWICWYVFIITQFICIKDDFISMSPSNCARGELCVWVCVSCSLQLCTCVCVCV